MNSPLAETRESIRSTAGRAPARRDRAAYSRMIRSIWMAMPDTGQPIGRAAPASRAQLAVPLSVLAAILRQAGGDMAHTLEAFLNRHCGPNVDSRGPIVSGRRCGPIVKMKRYTALIQTLEKPCRAKAVPERRAVRKKRVGHRKRFQVWQGCAFRTAEGRWRRLGRLDRDSSREWGRFPGEIGVWSAGDEW